MSEEKTDLDKCIKIITILQMEYDAIHHLLEVHLSKSAKTDFGVELTAPELQEMRTEIATSMAEIFSRAMYKNRNSLN